MSSESFDFRLVGVSGVRGSSLEGWACRERFLVDFILLTVHVTGLYDLLEGRICCEIPISYVQYQLDVQYQLYKLVSMVRNFIMIKL